MKTIITQWGADYLVTDEPVNPAPVTLTSPEGLTLVPGQRVTQIGSKKRSCFSMKPPHTMTYQGVMGVEGTDYAIFHCPAHDDPQPSLFGPTIQYRYAFALVSVHDQFQCFLLGTGGHKGLRDIRMDYLA